MGMKSVRFPSYVLGLEQLVPRILELLSIFHQQSLGPVVRYQIDFPEREEELDRGVKIYYRSRGDGIRVTGYFYTFTSDRAGELPYEIKVGPNVGSVKVHYTDPKSSFRTPVRIHLHLDQAALLNLVHPLAHCSKRPGSFLDCFRRFCADPSTEVETENMEKARDAYQRLQGLTQEGEARASSAAA